MTDDTEFEKLLKSVEKAGRARYARLVQSGFKLFPNGVEKKCQYTRDKKQSKVKSVFIEFVRVALKL